MAWLPGAAVPSLGAFGGGNLVDGRSRTPRDGRSSWLGAAMSSRSPTDDVSHDAIARTGGRRTHLQG
eukprot:scaffold217361_cov37-Tisochrysis_lutea.AAC.6